MAFAGTSMLFNALPIDTSHDVCIVGAGPAGISLALECERLHLKVLLLEAGGQRDAWWRRSDAAEVTQAALHDPLEQTTRQAFGGTSWAWSGNCIPFDDIDFEQRDHVSYSGWPIAHRDLTRFYQTASQLLGCEPLGDRAAERTWGNIDLRLLEIPSQPQLARRYRRHFEQSTLITLCLNAPVVRLEFDASGCRVIGVTVATSGGHESLKVSLAVLAGGGLRTTQLLLEAQRRMPSYFGGAGGPLGRYYMGHLAGSIAAIKFNDPLDADRFRPHLRREGHYAPWRFTLSRDVQYAKQILNASFSPLAPVLDNPEHEDGTLSAAYLFQALSRLAARFLPGQTVEEKSLYESKLPHLRNIVRAPVRTARGLLQALLDEIRLRPSVSLMAQTARHRTYRLQYLSETEPNPASRVELANGRDKNDLPRLRIDFRYTDRDIDSVLRAHDALDEELRKSGLAQMRYLYPLHQRRQRVWELAKDGYHQIGTTRMGLTPKDSVVDPNCRVHGLDNLYIASSSVFPTSGHANPTFLCVALAVRLAGEIAKRAAADQRVS